MIEQRLRYNLSRWNQKPRAELTQTVAWQNSQLGLSASDDEHWH
jgi:hypothetical protein